MNETYEEFRQSWIDDIIVGEQSPTEKGRVFALKIIHQWLNLDAETDEENDNLFYCDGAGDGGIDLAYLQRSDAEDTLGDTWYLVQSKYGAAFQGESTLIDEGRKVIATLEGERATLASLSAQVLERLENFRQSQGNNDKVVLVFATVDPLSENEKKALRDVRSIGRERLPFDFGVEAISIRTIFDRLSEAQTERTCVPLAFEVPQPELAAQLLVGTVALPDVYQFLRAFKNKRQDLDALYAKNVRLFLGANKINKKIIATLEDTPELFGFYNNGITVVVSDYSYADGELELCNPSIVNGCQTTRSIWEVFDKKEGSGGTGHSAALTKWRGKAGQGTVIVKIVRVDETGARQLLKDIVRYTNSQNAVKEQDFLALEADFRSWQKAMAEAGIYLEIQRGGSDAQKARQKKSTKIHHYDEKSFVNAFELLKVYGAGWLGEPGPAWNKNAAFLPGGSFFKTIVDSGFGPQDLLECFYLQRAANEFGFGSRSKSVEQTRRITRFLFYFVALEMLRRLLLRSGLPDDAKTCTSALRILRASDGGEWKELLNAALLVIDNYMKTGAMSSIFQDPIFDAQFGGNLNGYLKSEAFAKTKETSPGLWEWLGRAEWNLSLSVGSQPSRESQIAEVLHAGLD